MAEQNNQKKQQMGVTTVEAEKYTGKELADILLNQISELETYDNPPGKIKTLITDLNNSIGDPPLSGAEMKAMIYPFITGLDDTTDDFVSIDQVKAEPTTWLFKDRIPQGEITLLGGAGGSGKTSLWVALAVAVASGKSSIFDKNTDDEIPFNEPGNVLFLTTEDSISKVLKNDFEKYDIKPEYQKNIFGIDAGNKNISRYLFDSQPLREQIERYKPALVIFDPLQGFVPDGVEMSKRNQMRHVMAPLKALGAKYGTSFLVVQHTNKREKATGARNRLSDSSDTYDIARSVLMVGTTGKKDKNGSMIRYICTEKASYAPVEKIPSILFTLDGGKINFHGVTDKKEDELLAERRAVYSSERTQPARDEIKEELLNHLQDNGGEMETRALDNYLVDELGFRRRTVERARSDLRKEQIIKVRSTGFGKEKKNFTILSNNEMAGKQNSRGGE